MRIPDALVIQLVSSTRKLSDEQVAYLRSQEKELHKSMQELVTLANIITESELTKLYTRQLHIPYIDLELLTIDLELLKKLPERVARMHKVVLFSINSDGSVNAAFTDKPSEKTLELIQKYIKQPVHVHVASQTSVARWLNQYRVIDSHIGPLIKISRDHKRNSREVSGYDLANELLKQAIERMATDIHIDPHEHSAQVRFRIDGRLQSFHPLSLDQYQTLSRYLMDDIANLHTSNTSAPREGIFTHSLGDKAYKISIAVLPVIDGQKISLQINEIIHEPRDLSDLGLWGPSLNRVEHALTQTSGLMLVVGPGKSGKTTTLHGLLKAKHDTHVSMIAIEESNAYSEQYISHVIVNQKRGSTYERALSSALQHDPDVILIQRLQDTITAKKAITASEHRQLICSGLVAPTASESIAKLRRLEIPAHDIASSLKCVIGQRLVRTLCSHCKLQVPITENVAQKIGLIMNTSPSYSMKDIHVIEKAAAAQGIGDPKNIMSTSKKIQSIWTNNPEGCDRCLETGYSGQTGIFEVMTMTKDLTSAIVADKDTKKLFDTAVNDGMIPMPIDGLVKVLRGITSLDEVERAIQAIY